MTYKTLFFGTTLSNKIVSYVGTDILFEKKNKKLNFDTLKINKNKVIICFLKSLKDWKYT